MGRPAKSLVAHLRQGTFRARRHHQLLGGPDVPWPGFALLQRRYRGATSDPERRAVAVECERVAAQARAVADAEVAGGGGRNLDQELLTLGKPGSIRQLLGFFPHFLRHSKGPLFGQPFQLEAWQKNFLRELYRRDQNGRRIYKRALLGVPHGNGKTALAAGLALYELISQTDSPEIYLAAGAKEQARIGLDYARGFVEQGPLADWITTGSTLTCASRRGKIEAISSEGALQHGRAPSAAMIDELGSFSTRRQEETYTALATGLHKRPDAYLLATSTAGPNRDSLLGRIYDDALGWDDINVSANGCLTVAKNIEAGALLWWYGAPAGADPENPKTIRACNPASWIAVPDLQRQLLDPGLSENDFRRHHLNQWTPTQNATATTTDAPSSGHLRSTNPDARAQLRGAQITPEQIEQQLLELERLFPPNPAATTPTSSSAPPKTANPAAWIKTSELKRQLADPGLDELEFRRLNLNQWTRVREAWLPDGCWQGLRCDQEIPAGGAIYVGVDVGLYHDSTAVCWAHMLEDGRILLRSHVWSAKLDALAHTYCPDGKVALEQVEAFIRQLARDYRLRELAFDPHFFNRSAELLEDAGIKTIEFLQASGPMADAYQGFYQLALEGKLAHDGDPVFAAHIEATAASKSERGWKLRKLHNKKRIDATVAAALAVARARHQRKRKANIYWMEP